MKKILFSLLVTVLLLSVVACSTTKPDETPEEVVPATEDSQEVVVEESGKTASEVKEAPPVREDAPQTTSEELPTDLVLLDLNEENKEKFEDYMMAAYAAGVLNEDYDPEQGPALNKIFFAYGYNEVWMNEYPYEEIDGTQYMFLEAEGFETYATSLFDVTVEELHTLEQYHADRNEYDFYSEGIGGGPSPIFEKAEESPGTGEIFLTIQFYDFDNSTPEGPKGVIVLKPDSEGNIKISHFFDLE